MYIDICIYIYVYIYICIYKYVYIYIYICICVYIFFIIGISDRLKSTSNHESFWNHFLDPLHDLDSSFNRWVGESRRETCPNQGADVWNTLENTKVSLKKSFNSYGWPVFWVRLERMSDMKYLEWFEFNSSRHHAILKTAISAGDFGEFEDNPTELSNDQSILCQSYELLVTKKKLGNIIICPDNYGKIHYY